MTYLIVLILPHDPYLFVVDRIVGIDECALNESSIVPSGDVKRSKQMVDVDEEILDLRRIWAICSEFSIHVVSNIC